MRAFREKFGELAGDDIGVRLQAFIHDFLQHDATADKKHETPALKP
jgi:hypothetical protein